MLENQVLFFCNTIECNVLSKPEAPAEAACEIEESVSYEVIILEYYADWWMGWAHCSMGCSLVRLVRTSNSAPLLTGPHC